MVARFGGEEFCVVLKKIAKEEAIKFFVNLRAKVAENEVIIKDKTIKSDRFYWGFFWERSLRDR